MQNAKRDIKEELRILIYKGYAPEMSNAKLFLKRVLKNEYYSQNSDSQIFQKRKHNQYIKMRKSRIIRQSQWKQVN
jgi:hypothetical protein